MTQQHLSDIGRLVGSRAYILVAGSTLMVILARWLSPEAFGQYQLIMSLVFTFPIVLDWGVSQSLPRYLAECRGQDPKSVRAAFLVGLRLKLLALITGGLILVTIREPLQALFNLDSVEHLLPFGLLILVTISLNEFFLKLSEGFQIFKAIPVVTFLKNTGDLVLSVGLVLLGYGVAGALLGKLAATLFAVVVGFAWLMGAVFKAFPRSKSPSQSLVKKILSYGIWLLLIDVGDRVLMHGDRLLINRFLGPEMVGLYAVAARVAILSQVVGLSVASVVGPAMGKDPEASRPALRTGLRFVLALYSLLGVLLLGLGDIVILALFGDNYAGSIPSLRVFAMMLPLLGLSPVFSLVLNYRGVAKQRLVFVGLSMLITVLGNLILIPRIGILGSAVAMGVGQLVYVVGQGWYCSRMESFENFWPVLLTKTLFISIGSIISIWLLRLALGEGWLVLVAGGLVSIGNIWALLKWGVIKPMELRRLMPSWPISRS